MLKFLIWNAKLRL